MMGQTNPGIWRLGMWLLPLLVLGLTLTSCQQSKRVAQQQAWFHKSYGRGHKPVKVKRNRADRPVEALAENHRSELTEPDRAVQVQSAFQPSFQPISDKQIVVDSAQIQTLGSVVQDVRQGKLPKLRKFIQSQQQVVSAPVVENRPSVVPADKRNMHWGAIFGFLLALLGIVLVLPLIPAYFLTERAVQVMKAEPDRYNGFSQAMAKGGRIITFVFGALYGVTIVFSLLLLILLLPWILSNPSAD